MKNFPTAWGTGLNIKTGSVKTRGLPCILITNEKKQFDKWKTDKDCMYDCVFLEVDGHFLLTLPRRGM